MPSPLPDPVDLGLVHRALVTKLRHHGDVLLASPVFTVLGHAAPGGGNRCAGVRGNRSDARRPSGDRAKRTSSIATGSGRDLFRQARAERALLSALSQASLRSDRPSDRASARRVARRACCGRATASRAISIARTGCGERASPITTGCRDGRRATPSNAISTACVASACSRRRATRRWSSLPNGAATARVRGLLAQHGIEPRRFIQLHPGSRWLFKCWPAEHYAALLEQLAADGWRVALTGGAGPARARAGRCDPRRDREAGAKPRRRPRRSN